MPDPSLYGDAWASVYDEIHGGSDPRATVDVLAELAGTGPALELGIGTGRIAIPLAARGVVVHGIEASRAMIERMRAKPGGAAIPVTLGDFTDVAVDGAYTLIYAVASTLYGLLTQEAQVACLRNAAGRLGKDGVIVIEGFVPDVSRLVKQPQMHDPAGQRVSTRSDFAGVELPIDIRYIWPSELDLMARLAGLTLRERWGDWERRPYTGVDTHISIYERSATTRASPSSPSA